MLSLEILKYFAKNISWIPTPPLLLYNGYVNKYTIYCIVCAEDKYVKMSGESNNVLFICILVNSFIIKLIFIEPFVCDSDCDRG